MVKNKWYIGGLHFECQQCGKCCSGPQEGVIWISRQEIKILAKHLSQSPNDVRKKSLKRLRLSFSIRENPESKDCIFLVNINGSKTCAIYNFRPMQCRKWPFWPNNLNNPDDWNAAAMKCPGINPVRDKESRIPDGHQRWPVSNGVNKGRLYTYDEIQKIKRQKQWWTCLAPTPEFIRRKFTEGGVGVQSRDSNGAVTLKICDQVAKIYDWLDSNLKPFNNQCAACGKCCRFESFGHKLFVTTPELLYFYENVKLLRKMTGSCCPYLENGTPPHQFILQRTNLKEHLEPIGLAFKTPHRGTNWCGGKCTVRNYRFAGCRIFFCKADTNLQNKLSEEAVEKFKLLCEKFNFPYRYIDLTTALNMKNEIAAFADQTEIIK